MYTHMRAHIHMYVYTIYIHTYIHTIHTFMYTDIHTHV